MAVDIAVVCPVAASHLREDEPCEAYAALHKHARYDGSFKDSNYDFVEMVFETSGAVNEEGLAVLKQIFGALPKEVVRATHPFVLEHGLVYLAAFRPPWPK